MVLHQALQRAEFFDNPTNNERSIKTVPWKELLRKIFWFKTGFPQNKHISAPD
jgi:hypothetical protein